MKLYLPILFSLPVIANAAVLKSPDGSLKVDVNVKDNHLVYSITHTKTPIIETSQMGVVVGGKDLGAGAKLGKETTYTVDESYAWRGVKSRVENKCNGKRIAIESGDRKWEVELRAYNEGIAFRYHFKLAKPTLITGESTNFTLPEKTTAWYQSNTAHYEGKFTKNQIDEIPLNVPHKRKKNVKNVNTLGAPITLMFPNGMYGALTEADIMGYSGMTYSVNGTYTLNSLFEDDKKGWTLKGDIKTPWRVTMVAEDLNELVNNDMVHNVCPAPDAKLFPKGIETDWIQTGRALWQWWAYNNPGTHWSKQEWFVDQAAKLNCEYYLVDEGWEHSRQEWFKPGESPWKRMKELVDYAAERKIKILVWRSWYGSEKKQFPGLKTEAQREDFFKKCAEVGVKGVKIDFLNSEGHDRLEFYKDCLLKGAQYKIMVNFHGANKPAGEPRTWPNEVTREGIHGLEHNKWSTFTSEHYTTLPFTRYLAGHGDFTPTTFQSKFQKGTTSTLQMASAVVFTSPMLCWADKPNIYLKSSAVEYIKAMPSTWDETRVLKGSTISGVAAFARRSGNEWYVSVMNGTKKAQSYDLDLGFLSEGNYLGSSISDDSSDPMKMVHASGEYSSKSKVSVKMLPSGGYLLRLSKFTMTPYGGGIEGKQDVTIGTADSGADVRYTTDGSEPTAKSAKVDGPITLSKSCELRVKIITGKDKGSEIRNNFIKGLKAL